MINKNIGESEIRKLIPEIDSMTWVVSGGQKTVFKVSIEGRSYALKTLRLERKAPKPEDGEGTEAEPEEAYARARREVNILRDCDIPELVRLGPVTLTSVEVTGGNLILYTEEWVDGTDLATFIAQKGPLSIEETIRMARDINRAIAKLWSLSKIHRDIKPANIMRRSPGPGFVLLDLGLALDLVDVSLTDPGQAPGTLPYFSPEQLEPLRKRNMDFRSDLYALGVVMYEAVTGVHPYCTSGMRSKDTITNILSAVAVRPSQRRSDVPQGLEDVILRLLAKNPHLRYRSCEQLDSALAVACEA